MQLALYRKYRPQTFSEIIGQEHIKTILQNEITQKRLAHAYLFCGPRGISKTTMARIFAKAVNCENVNKTGEPCNKCLNCRNIIDESSLDFIEIDAASNTGVDHVRERIIENSRIMPAKEKYKLFVIDEAHMLSLSAFNALLKILEEPPSYVIFILATTEVHKIPTTILSRCQRFDFRKIDQKSMIGRLEMIAKKEQYEVEPDVLTTIARYSLGHERDAESMLSQILSLNKKKITLEDAFLILPKNNTTLVWSMIQNLQKPLENNFKLFEDSLDQGIDPKQLTREVVEFLRQLLFIKVGRKLDQTAHLDLDQKSFQEIIYFLEKISVKELVTALELFIEAEKKLKFDPFILQLPLEIAVIQYQERFPPRNNEKNGENNEDEEEIIQTTLSNNGNAKKEKIATEKNFENIQKRWGDILTNIQKKNQSLLMVLKGGRLKALQENKLIITFGYQFHRDFLSRPDQRKILESHIEQVIQEKIFIECEIDPELRLNKTMKQKEPQIQEALNVFGGQVID